MSITQAWKRNVAAREAAVVANERWIEGTNRGEATIVVQGGLLDMTVSGRRIIFSPGER
jgi:hypothetical protein